MHAASVHPEPGSNSLKKLYIKLYSESTGFLHRLYAALNSLHNLFSLDTVFLEPIVWFALILWIYLLIRVSKELSRFVIILYNLSVCFLRFLFGSLTALYLIYLLLFNFQGPFCLPLALRFFSLLRDSYIISYSEPFVKGFCKSFLSFFSKSLFCFARLTRPLYYIIFLRVCQEVFEKFFEVFFGRPFGYRFASDFNIISHFFRFVKGFFKKNWKNLKFLP